MPGSFRMHRATLCVLVLAASVACSRHDSVSRPAIHLSIGSPQAPAVEVLGLSPGDLAALSSAGLSDDEWASVLRVTVQGSDVSVAGHYSVGSSLRFTPAFPLDPGRKYDVLFDPSRVTRRRLPPVASARSVVALPAVERPAGTVVTAIYPSGDEIPENQLRMYVHFSAPMGQQSGTEHIVLLDDGGKERTGAILPLDTELWNPDRTRYTVLLDPGRVKREILPNRSMGRPLRRGEKITVLVQSDWVDGRGVPLKSEFRHTYRVGPPRERPLDPSSWQILPPPAGSREPIVVTFPEPLDHALLERAVRVTRAGVGVPGEPSIEAGETRWIFVPREPWSAGDHALVVQPFLEDVAGNRMGRAFEVRSPGDAVPPESSNPTTLPFRVAPVGR